MGDVDPSLADREAREGDARRVAEEAREAEYLARRRCPYSGLDLRLEVRDGWGLPPGYLCSMCDCFGFSPEEVG